MQRTVGINRRDVRPSIAIEISGGDHNRIGGDIELARLKFIQTNEPPNLPTRHYVRTAPVFKVAKCERSAHRPLGSHLMQAAVLVDENTSLTVASPHEIGPTVIIDVARLQQ